MKIFISWSSRASESVAISLRSFLTEVNGNWKPWVSKVDIAAGAAWRGQLRSAINSSGFGIVCANWETLHSPWVLFETGALSAILSDGKICPYLLDTPPEKVTGPLADFQSKSSTRQGTIDLVKALQIGCPERAVPEDELSKRIEAAWPALDSSIRQAQSLLASQHRPPTHNRVDGEGLRALLNIHFAASAGDLTYILDQAIDKAADDMANKRKVKKGAILDELECAARSKIRERRTHLARFYSDQFGYVSEMLEQFFPTDDVRRRLKENFKFVLRSPDPKKAAFKLIRNEQTELERIVAERLKKDGA